MIKKIISLLIVITMLMSILPIMPVSAGDAVSDPSVFVKQSKSGRCTLASAVMMLRRNAYLEGNANWKSITEDSTKSVAWSSGLNWDFTYAGMRVVKGSFSKMSKQEKKTKLISLLESHPEGIVIYMYGDGRKTHAVLATDYERSTDTVYCADPASGIAKGRIPLTSAYLTGETQDDRIGNLKMYWYIKSGNCNLTTPAVTPPVHSHSYNYSNDSSHPHSEYKYCSCGDKEYTGNNKLVSSCAKCYPIGSIKLTREYEKSRGIAIFYRNSVKNVTEYTLEVYSNNGLYGRYTMSSDTYKVTGLPSGDYYGVLYAENSFTGEERSARCDGFKIVETYTISYNANGGKNAPPSQTKIEDEELPLTTSVPTRAHYIFKGWARSKNATVAEYQPGDTYSRNAKVIFYAVWEPKIYTVTFDANGGVGSIDSKSFTYGDTIRIPNSTTKDFSYLKGWSTNKNATTPEYNINLDYKIEGDLTLYAVWGKTNWSGEVASSYAGGSGTSTDPYLIENSAQLALLANHVNSQTSSPEYKYYKLISNIDLGYNNWVPIGIGDVQYQKFCGEFDGDGYTISGLYISGNSYNYIGLFGRTDSATIKNFTLSGGDIEDVCYTGTKSFYLGGVVGNGNVENVTVKDFNISSVYSAVESYSMRTCIGIVCGEGTVLNCDVISSYILDCTSESNLFVGGVLGYSPSRSVPNDKIPDVINCTVSNEDVIFEKVYSKDSKGFTCIGGVVGHTDGKIERCFVKSGRLMNKQVVPGSITVGGVAGRTKEANGCQVHFTNRENITYLSQSLPYSIYVVSPNGSVKVSGIALSSKISDCKYDGASLLADSTDTAMSNPFYYSCAVGGMSAEVSSTTSNVDSVKSSFVNVDGIITAHASNYYCFAGGLMGSSLLWSDGKISAKSSLVLVDKVAAICDAGNQTSIFDKTVYTGGQAGDVVCWENVNVEKCYTADIIDLTATTGTYNTAILKSENRIKTVSFQKSLLGLSEYQSIDYMNENSDAVWVLEEGELPDLYYYHLNDITISKDIENGTISVDKTQAVDGELVTITATPAEGYVLNTVYVNGAEIVGTTFYVSGDAVIYATFAEKIPEFKVSVTADENATALLVNADSPELSLMSPTDSLIASDGEEIRVNAEANEDYAIESILVNGEEIAGTSFILTNDSVITLKVANISTSIDAETYDAEDAGDYFAVVSGVVSGSDGNAVRYIRYWSADNPEIVYTTDVETGTGEYTAELMNLKPETTYYYQMTEFGDVKSFTTCSAPDDGPEVETIAPLTTTTYKALTATYKFTVESSVALETEMLAIGVYDMSGNLLSVKFIECDGDTTYTESFSKTLDISYAKVFVWDSKSGLKPLGGVETVTMK